MNFMISGRYVEARSTLKKFLPIEQLNTLQTSEENQELVNKDLKNAEIAESAILNSGSLAFFGSIGTVIESTVMKPIDDKSDCKKSAENKGISALFKDHNIKNCLIMAVTTWSIYSTLYNGLILFVSRLEGDVFTNIYLMAEVI